MTTVRAEPSDLTRFYGLFPQPALARDLFNVVEGYRVDLLIRRAYPGIRRDMEAIRSASAERRPSLLSLTDAQMVVEVLLQRGFGIDPDLTDVAPAARALAERAADLLIERISADSQVADSARLTSQLYRLIDDGIASAGEQFQQDATPPEAPPPPQGSEQDAPESDQGGLDTEDYEPLELPPFMTPVLEEMVRQQDAPAQAQAIQPEGQEGQSPDTPEGGDEEGGDADTSMSTSQVQPGGDRSPDDVAQAGSSQEEEVPPGAGAAADSRRDDAEGGTPGADTGSAVEIAPGQDGEIPEEGLGEQLFLYDEWDFKIDDYRPSWCTLREQRATRTQEGFVAATFHEFGGIVTQIRRNFQLMRPERLRKMRYQTEGDDLDTDGLVEYVVDRRARVAPTGQVYIKRDKTERDVTTAFLVDMSSSTDRKIDGRKRIIDIEKEGLLLMCEALEAIRDEYAIYGFSGSGRDDCEFYVVKELGERYDDRVKGRIGGIYARQKTRMGPAIRHATRRLASADSAVKLMILLTDGKPYDSDTYQDNQYAQEDTKIALREARREKIHLFCVTVDREAADYLPHMYSDANFVIIDDVRTLPQKLPQLYRRLTT
jgi:hypothetical protein